MGGRFGKEMRKHGSGIKGSGEEQDTYKSVATQTRRAF